MGTALYTGVTGLQAHQRRLDVIASNIANVNTVGYRSSRVIFQDLFSETLRAGSPPVGRFGGSNPQQVGLGVRVSSIDVNHTQGSFVTTGVASDLAIQGAGFFVLSDGVRYTYTRDGSFSLNANGMLIEGGTGMRVQGFMAGEDGTISNDAIPTDIRIPLGGDSIVNATTRAKMVGNLNAAAEPGDTVVRTVSVYDSLGIERLITLTFTREAAPTNTWTWEATYNRGTADTPDLVNVAVGAVPLTFGPNGTLAEGDPAAIGQISISAADLGTPASQPQDPFEFVFDFTSVTQLSEGVDPVTQVPFPSDVTLLNQDGYPKGNLESFNIGTNGEIIGMYSNGLNRVIGQISVATFANVGGLIRIGANMFMGTPASGAAQIGAPETGGRGSVTGGVLENSNVDLGTEFSNLIITQRGFQANARTITTADTILQETVNLVR